MVKRAIVLEVGSPEERAPYAEAIAARGLRIADRADDSGTAGCITVRRHEDTMTVSSSSHEAPANLSPSIGPADLASFLGALVELAGLRDGLREAEAADGIRLLACMITHDANNVLMAITSAADELAARSTPDLAPLADEVLDGCRRLTTLMRQVMATSRAAGPKGVDVNAVIGALTPTLRTVAGANVQVVTHFQDPLPPVHMDPVDLERSLLNLVANASDAMGGRGSLLLSTSSVWRGPDDADVTTEKPWVLVEVQDRGAGMDDATLARAFEPFFTTKPAGRGTGLGLPSVLRAVRGAGGQVRIESAPGQGTRVQLWLPASPASTSTPPASRGARAW
jgi:signal transduction histidine kinase